MWDNFRILHLTRGFLGFYRVAMYARVRARTYYDRESGNYPAYPAYLTPKSMLNDIPVGVG